VPNHIIFSRPY